MLKEVPVPKEWQDQDGNRRFSGYYGFLGGSEFLVELDLKKQII